MQAFSVTVLLLVILVSAQGFAVGGAFRRGVVLSRSSSSSSSCARLPPTKTQIFALVPDNETPSDAPSSDVDQQQQQQPMISRGADALCD